MSFPLQQFKMVLMLPPVSVASTTATQISYWDFQGTGQVLATAPTGPVMGCEGALFIFGFGAVGSPSTGTAHSIVECDTYNGTYTAITGALLTAAPVASSFSTIYLTNRGRKRFARAINTTDSTQLCTVIGMACSLDQSANVIGEIGAKCLESIIL